MLPQLLALILSAAAPTLISKPIPFSEKRKALTRAYIKEHYGVETTTIAIDPRLIVVHWTGLATLASSFRAFEREEIGDHRHELKGSSLGVSAHFLVDRDGAIYQLMPDNWMARHVIGLNHTAIGIENVGGVGGKEDLTEAQLKANVELVRYLQSKYPKIGRVIGHYEYLSLEKTPFFKELNTSYRTKKVDPGPKFMKALRAKLKEDCLRRDSNARPVA